MAPNPTIMQAVEHLGYRVTVRRRHPGRIER